VRLPSQHCGLGPVVLPRMMIAKWTSRLDRLGLTPNLSTRALWLSSDTSLEPVGDERRKCEFSLSIPVGLKSSFTCRKILRRGTFQLYSPSERKVCCGFVSLLKSIAVVGLEPATFGSSCKHTNHYTTKATLLQNRVCSYARLFFPRNF
jgi:hypothetical protein